MEMRRAILIRRPLSLTLPHKGGGNHVALVAMLGVGTGPEFSYRPTNIGAWHVPSPLVGEG